MKNQKRKKAVKTDLDARGIKAERIRMMDGNAVVYVSPETMSQMIRAFCDESEAADREKRRRRDPTPPYLFIAREDDGTCTVCEGKTKNCYCENYSTEKIAMKWLLEDYDGLEDLEEESRLAWEKRKNPVRLWTGLWKR